MTETFFNFLLGAALPPEKEKTEHFDSNCITPVSVNCITVDPACRSYSNSFCFTDLHIY